VVEAGDSLWTIAQRHGCDVAELTEVNRLEGTTIQPGQRLELPMCDGRSAPSSGPQRTLAVASADRGSRVEHEVVSGDTLGKLATRYRVSIDELRERNGLDGDRIVAGQKLVITGPPAAPARPPTVTGQSRGHPADGRLQRATRLPDDRAYFIRRPDRRWGTSQAVHHVRAAARAVRREFPRIHKLAVGDLSIQRGGKITLHNSHQSGRDVDLGFYYRRKPRQYPEEFVRATRGNIDFAATWLLLETLAKTASAANGVERMYLSYTTQRILYDIAVERGVPGPTLDWMFQYPHGEGTASGLIRHWPNHEDHIHVRFACPADDDGCH
jgi:LysM repeat protein